MTTPPAGGGYTVNTQDLRQAAAGLQQAGAELVQDSQIISGWQMPAGTFTMLDSTTDVSVSVAFATLMQNLEQVIGALGSRFEQLATGLQNSAAAYDRNQAASTQTVQAAGQGAQ